MFRLSMLTVYFTLMLAAIANARSSWGFHAATTMFSNPMIVFIGAFVLALFTLVVTYWRSRTE